MKRAAAASLAVAGVLILMKFAAWLATDSVGLLSTLIDSLLDVAASFVNFLAVRQALTPADREHRFGHGKAEPLAGLTQAAFICGSALFLMIQAGDRLIYPRPIANPEVGYVVLVASIILTMGLVAFQSHVVRKTGSIAVNADSLHYKSDLLVNGSVIVSLYVTTKFGWLSVDPLIAIAIAAYIVWGAWRIGAHSLDILMDHELPQSEREKIRNIVKAHPEVKGLHDLRTRSAGQQIFIQLHLELDGELKLKDVHEISEAVMAELQAAFPTAEVIVHEDPEGAMEPRKVFQ
ncbi:MAG: cation diffusion facilitator family transporter [Rhodospirillales bacterium]|nr:cation diffusion facilitator family transporter [Rhodospirillales bacterium]